MQLSIAQILAQRAAMSRRAVAKLISAGQVEVNGKPCTNISARPPAGAKIKLAGELLPPAKTGIRRQVLLYHKPVGELCGQVYDTAPAAEEQGPEPSKRERVTPEGPGREPSKQGPGKRERHKQEGSGQEQLASKPQATRPRRSVFDGLPPLHNGKWIMVGRLDINTSGLLLFTNDGELAYRLMHPKYQLDREYIARVKGRSRVTDRTLQQLKKGIYLQDSPAGARGAAGYNKLSGEGDSKGPRGGDSDGAGGSSRLDGGRGKGSRSGKRQRTLARFSDIVPMHKQSNSSNQYFYLVVQEGRNRLVRRVWESVGYQVSRLIRVRFATVNLPPEMKPGKSVLLKQQDIKALAACVGL